MRAWPRLIAITDCGLLPASEQLARLARLAADAEAGSVALLLRDHGLSGGARLDFGQRLQAVARRAAQQLWVADRLDLALLLEADVLHLGEASVSAVAARAVWPRSRRIARAWHALAVTHAAEAELAGVDALLVSPVLSPRKGRPALGLSAFAALGEQLRARNQAYPLYALGGVAPENAASCLTAGAAGVAAIGAALAADCAPLLRALDILR